MTADSSITVSVDAPRSADVPTAAQLRYLARGLSQPGGKLPLFDEDGQAVPVDVVRACIERGLASPWFDNPIKPDWLVCRLTDRGRDLINVTNVTNVPATGGVPGQQPPLKVAANDVG